MGYSSCDLRLRFVASKCWDRLRFKWMLVFWASVACSFLALHPPAVASALISTGGMYIHRAWICPASFVRGLTLLGESLPPQDSLSPIYVFEHHKHQESSLGGLLEGVSLTVEPGPSCKQTKASHRKQHKMASDEQAGARAAWPYLVLGPSCIQQVKNSSSSVKKTNSMYLFGPG